MTTMKYTPSFIIYECLVTTYGYCDNVLRSIGIFDELSKSTKEMKISTFNAMLEAYCINSLPIKADLETFSSSLASSRCASDKTDSSRSLSTAKAYIEEIK